MKKEEEQVRHYLRFSDALKARYGKKVYKLPLHVPGSCPNRDGKISYGGCSFCAEGAMDFELLDCALPIREQLKKNKDYMGSRYGAEKFIAYFQNYSATYRPTEELLFMMEQCLMDDLVEISLSTRPDCLDDGMLQSIKEFSLEHQLEISIELGVQCLNDKILMSMRRGHNAKASLDAMKMVKEKGLLLGVHAILNYPGMEKEDVKHIAEVFSAYGVDRVKLHSLYVEKNTFLGNAYEKGEVDICSAEEYLERILLFLGYLDERIAVERFFARAPEETTLFCNWSRSWRYLMNELEKIMHERNFKQGELRRNPCTM